MKSNRLFDLFLGLDILDVGLKSDMFEYGIIFLKEKWKMFTTVFFHFCNKNCFYVPKASILNYSQARISLKSKGRGKKSCKEIVPALYYDTV